MAQIFGTPFDDSLHDTPDDDTLLGQSGNDHLYGTQGNDTLVGEAGDDVLEDAKGSDTLDGGDGNDLLLVWAAQYASPFVNSTGVDTAFGGAGHDMLVVRGVGLAHQLGGGAGSDYFSFAPASGALAPATLATFQITDFSLADDDRLVVTASLPRSGRGEAPAGFTASVGEALPQGGVPGTEVQLWSLADAGQTVLYADLNGNAVVDALDLRVALAGNGPLSLAAFGAGTFAPQLGSTAADTIVGLPIDDMLFGNGGDDTIDGGPGNDYLVTLEGNDTLNGGPGRDQLAAGSGLNTVDGGDGDDHIDLDGDAASQTQATGGVGQDGFLLHTSGAGVEILDFQPGPGGDLLDVQLLLQSLPGPVNPFDPGIGLLRLVGLPTSTELQWDASGAADGAQWLTVARLTGVPAPALVPQNFSGANASAITALTIVPGNQAPVLQQPLPDLWVDEDASVGFVPSVTTFSDDGLTRELSITATRADGSPLPAWLQFVGGEGLYNGGVPGIGQFSGSPGNGDVGNLSLRLTATDAQGLQASDDFTLIVRNTNDAPTVAQVPPPIVAAAGTFLDWTLPSGTFVDEDAGDLLALSAASVDAVGPFLLPAWLQFDASSGRLSGMPMYTDAGTVTLRFKAFDTGGAVAAVEVPLIVQNPNQAPQAVADSATLPAGSSVQLTVLVNDSDPDVGQTLQLSGFSQPTYGSVAAWPGASTLTYTPLPAWNGTDRFSYTVSDGAGGSASATVTLSVQAQLLGTDSANSLVGTATADSIDARAGNDVVDAGAGDDFVRAGDGGDRVQAGEGHDTVLGGTGNDTLYGGNGADVLVGGPGVDSLVGGPTTRGDGSADLFVFDTTPNTSTNRDYVYGFEATSRDRIVLSPAIFGPLLAGSSAGVDADELRVGRAVQALDGNDHLLFDSQTGQLFFDADGTGPLARMVVAQLVGLVGTLDASDFTLEMPAGV